MALTAERNKTSLTEKSQPPLSDTGREESAGVTSSLAPFTMWKPEFLFILNSPFNFRMKLPNNSIYLSINCGLLFIHLCTHMLFESLC